MLAASVDFATMVGGVEQTGAWHVAIALPGGIYPDLTFAVEKLTLDAQTVSDLPAGTRLQEGYPSLAADITLSGLVDATDESKTAAWLFGRYSTSSPLYHQDVLYAAVTVDLGLYTATAAGTPETVRKFTGVVDDYTVGDDGSVTFTCVDKVRAALRSVPSLPAVITAPPFNAGLTSEFALDYLLRAATAGAISSWPARRPQCIFAVGLRSSLWPEIGSLSSGSVQPTPVFIPGPWGTGATLSTTGIGYAFPTWTTNVPPDADINFECLVSGVTGANTIFYLGTATIGDEYFQINVTSSGVTVSWNRLSPLAADSYTFATTINAAAHVVNVKLQMAPGSANWSTTIRVDSVTNASGTRTAVGATRSNASYNTFTIDVNDHATAVAGVQVTTETTAATSYPFTPQAVLDPSLNALAIVPEIPAGDPFQPIQQIADAELAVAGGDEAGIFRFYNRATIRGATSARAITSAASLTGIGGVETTAAAVVNHATAEYTGWNFATARTTAWSLATARKVPKGGTVTLKATTSSLFANVDTTATNLAGGSGDVANSHYRASVDKAGTAEFGGTLTFTVTQTGSTQLQIVVANSSGQDAWLVSPANYVDIPVGTPLLRIAALAVTPADTLTAEFQYPNPASGSRFGDQSHQISGNPWIQDDTAAANLVYDLVQDMYLPKPNLTGVAIVPDPRIQLVDVVHVQDPDRTGVDEYARVFGWHIDWAAGNYAMTLDARTVALPGGWIGGVAGRSEGGVTTYGF